MKICVICGKPAECKHHLIFGTSKRRLADEDGLTVDMCNSCHNMAVKTYDRVHGNPMAEALSKMLGQALWEREHLKYFDEEAGDYAREAFTRRYGRSYL